MALTEEQRKRMEDNRQKAIGIKRQKQLEKEKNEKKNMTSGSAPSVFEAGGFVGKSLEMESPTKKQRTETRSKDIGTGEKHRKNKGGEASSNTNGNIAIDDDESSLEDFECDATPYISQTEAQRTYCIPKGTLDVCAFIEKDNPHRRGWSKMKLYHRSEVRTRARKRFGGKEGLVRERDTRRKKRFEKDLEEMKDVFN